MRALILMFAAIVCAAPAQAQTEGRVGIGGFVTVDHTTDDDVAGAISGGPLVRLTPRKGWGPAAGLNWFRADIDAPTGGDSPFARVRVRPLMAGVSYTVGSGTVLTSFSIIAGPSFNRAWFKDDFTGAAGAAIDADNSLAVRPGVGVTWTVAPRVAVIGFGGYMINRPGVTYRDRNGVEFSDRWKADAIVLGGGAVYSIF